MTTGLILQYRLPPGSGSKAILGYTRHQWGAVHFYAALTLIGLVALHIVLHWKWVTNTFGALTRPRAVKRAGAGAGGALLLLAVGLASAGSLAAPWLLSVGTGTPCDHDEGHGGGQGKGYRGGRSACDTCEGGTCPTTATAATEEPAAHGAGCTCESCDGTCPTTATATATPAAKGHGQGQGQAGEHGPGGIRGSMTLAEVAAEAGVPFERIVAELKLPAGTSPVETLGRLRKQHGFSMEEVRALVARLKADAKKTLDP